MRSSKMVIPTQDGWVLKDAVLDSLVPSRRNCVKNGVQDGKALGFVTVLRSEARRFSGARNRVSANRCRLLFRRTLSKADESTSW